MQDSRRRKSESVPSSLAGYISPVQSVLMQCSYHALLSFPQGSLSCPPLNHLDDYHATNRGESTGRGAARLARPVSDKGILRLCLPYPDLEIRGLARFPELAGNELYDADCPEFRRQYSTLQKSARASAKGSAFEAARNSLSNCMSPS